MRARAEVDVRALAPLVKAPMLVLHCEGDRVTPVALGREIAASIPGAHFESQAPVDDVFRVMDTLEIERRVLAGFSSGTVTALRAVLAQRGRVDGLLLMNGCGEVQSPDLPVRPGPAPRPRPPTACS